MSFILPCGQYSGRNPHSVPLRNAFGDPTFPGAGTSRPSPAEASLGSRTGARKWHNELHFPFPFDPFPEAGITRAWSSPITLKLIKQLATAQKFCLCTEPQSPHIQTHGTGPAGVWGSGPPLPAAPTPLLPPSTNQRGFTIFSDLAKQARGFILYDLSYVL